MKNEKNNFKENRPQTSILKLKNESPRKKNINSTILLNENSSNRPQTESNLALKQWRMANFHINGVASRREVELLGEWLNSVLADNIESTKNPLDVVTNAQHWYSIAFNELLRQVSVSSAERSRLFAVIWKRNQDLFSKTIQLQKLEREYILKRHKDRIQFLKSDLDFCKSRLSTVENAYNEEKNRWDENHEKDISKFDSFQQKIDQQTLERSELEKEIKELSRKLGISDKKISNDLSNDFIFSFNDETLLYKIKEFSSKLFYSQKLNLNDSIQICDDITHYCDWIKNNSIDIRIKYEGYFLSLNSSYKPNIRSKNWLHSFISYIYSTYCFNLGKNDPKLMKNTNMLNFIYMNLLNIFGSRIKTESTFLDLLNTAQYYFQDSNSRIIFFLRFCGIYDPLPIHAFHFYLYFL